MEKKKPELTQTEKLYLELAQERERKEWMARHGFEDKKPVERTPWPDRETVAKGMAMIWERLERSEK